MISAGSTYDNKPYFKFGFVRITVIQKDGCRNHTLPGEWKWALIVVQSNE